MSTTQELEESGLLQAGQVLEMEYGLHVEQSLCHSNLQSTAVSKSYVWRTVLLVVTSLSLVTAGVIIGRQLQQHTEDSQPGVDAENPLLIASNKGKQSKGRTCSYVVSWSINAFQVDCDEVQLTKIGPSGGAPRTFMYRCSSPMLENGNQVGVAFNDGQHSLRVLGGTSADIYTGNINLFFDKCEGGAGSIDFPSSSWSYPGPPDYSTGRNPPIPAADYNGPAAGSGCFSRVGAGIIAAEVRNDGNTGFSTFSFTTRDGSCPQLSV
eukprot:gb/GEZN01012500.1/.p1 GENE.gb/GEZN01012500.1/~~gb/GEZN01012500.1/.p1  ORF type:complete len:266 (-),score=37.64 gb/GEZN01012500.1/:211-1008(-)